MPQVKLQLPPDRVAALLASYAGDWRESRLPEALRKCGVWGVTFAQTGTTFRIGFRGGDRLAGECYGSIAGTSTETTVTYDIRLDGHTALSFGIGLLLLVAILFAAQMPLAWSLQALGIGAAVIWLNRELASLHVRSKLSPGVNALFQSALQGAEVIPNGKEA